MRSRVLTALGLIPIVLGAFFCASPWPLLVLAEVAAFICATELFALLKSKRVWFGWLLGAGFALPMAALGPMLASNPTAPPRVQALQTIANFVLGVGAMYVATRYRPDGVLSNSHRSRLVLFAEFMVALWYILPFMCLLMLHGVQRSPGLWRLNDPALMAIVPLWGGDTAGILVGRALGRHLLAPAISPKKTVEGAIANFLACTLVAWPLGAALALPWDVSVACGLAAGVFGQLGDLFESYIKRQTGVKDSGALLPGHGGLLDRVDSLLFTAPLVFAILNFFR